MAQRELTGGTEEKIREMEGRFYNTPLYEKHDIPFDVAYCLAKIGKQPDEYDGPQRFCKNRAMKKDEDQYEGGKFTEGAYAVCCSYHGGNVEKHGQEQKDNLEPKTAPIKHGANAKDEHLKMDFDDDEQELYDSIMNDWPEIYNWPPKSEDPARYRMLRRVAVNEVRALREEDYLDGHEVHVKEIPTESGVQTEEVENPLAREYRLLMSEVTNQMKELGLTPKERQKMDSLSAQEEKDDALSDVAKDALEGDTEYDPDQFNE